MRTDAPNGLLTVLSWFSAVSDSFLYLLDICYQLSIKETVSHEYHIITNRHITSIPLIMAKTLKSANTQFLFVTFPSIQTIN